MRTHTCGEIRIKDLNQTVTLCGWVQKSRDLGGMTFVDLRDRYGITQLVFNMNTNKELCTKARNLGREFVISATGKVVERSNKNPNISTGDIEIIAEKLEILNASKIPPFTIEDHTDGGEDIRMQFRYLDIRRPLLKKNLELRHKVLQETRKYLDSQGFLEIETPFLIKSTPEGARDFVVPSRMNTGQFYALPQSPQTFKQILMVAGMDKYFQIVRCFRDEDLRSDRQPEFTQIDCEMSFVEREDVLKTFEGMICHLFKEIKNTTLEKFKVISYEEAMKNYGTDKPDLRFDMKLIELNDLTKGKGFNVFDNAELIVGICANGCAEFTRKELDELTEFVKKPQVGAKGLVYVKCNKDGTFKSSVDKFFDSNILKQWTEKFNAKPGDLLLILAGEKNLTRKAISELRIEMARRLGLLNKKKFAPLFVIDFPLLEWNEEMKRFFAMHHPFTAPQENDIVLLDSNPASVKANAYDLVINGVEIAGGSIRIHNKDLQHKMFSVLGFTKEEAEKQFGFLLGAFEYGAPPHGGIAFGFDRLCAMFSGTDSIRDVIAFPKNNSGRDLMLDSPSVISKEQLEELSISVKPTNKQETIVRNL